MRDRIPSRWIVVGTIAMLAAVFLWVDRNPAPADEKPVANAAIKELRRKRLETVIEIHKILHRRFEQGSIHVHELLQSRRSVLHASLDLCETKNDRIKAFEDMVTDAKEVLKKYQHIDLRLEELRIKAHLLE